MTITKTVSKDLAIKLKEAGFPQEEASFWYASALKTDGKDSFYVPLEAPHHVTEIEDYNYRKDSAALTADDILEWLPYAIAYKNLGMPDGPGSIYLLIHKKSDGTFGIGYYDFDGRMIISEYRKLGNLAEEAGNLWLHLKKKGLI